MNIRQLLGPDVNSDFVNAAAQDGLTTRPQGSPLARPPAATAPYTRGYADYPSFDLAYQYDEQYCAGYTAAYHDDCDAKEQRRLTDERYPRSAEIDRKNGF